MYHALIIEDNIFYRELISDVVELNGYNALISDQKEDITTLINENHSLSLIFLDLQLNERDGVQILREISQTQFQGYIVIISYLDQEILSSAYQLISEFNLKPLPPIQKPFKHKQIQALLDSHLHTSQLNLIFEESINTVTQDPNLKVTESLVSKLISQGKVVNFYQPIIRFRGHKFYSLECFSRLLTPTGKYIYPEQFLPIIEKDQKLSIKHLFLVLSNLEKDVVNLKQLQEHINISLNLTGQDISDIELPDKIEIYVKGLSIERSQLNFEIKHAHTVDCRRTALDVLIRLRLKGFSLCIDDFGSGTEDLKNLRHFPFSALKIDKVLTERVIDDPKAQVIVKNVIQLSHKLNLTVTAECIESEQVAESLYLMGCDFAQGYHYGIPDTLDNIADYLQKLNEHSESSLVDDDLKELSVKPLTPQEYKAHQNVLNLIEQHLDQQALSYSHQHNIALCVPLSGKLAALGKSYYLGANLAYFSLRETVDAIKEKVNFTVYNSGSSTQKMTEFFLQKQMSVIDSWFGPICPISDSKYLINQFSKTNKILFAPYNGSHEFHHKSHRNIFNFKNSYYEELKQISLYCDRKGGHKCLIMNNTSMSVGLKKIIESEFPEIDIILVESTEESDISHLLTRLKIMDPAHLMFVCSQKLFINLVLKYREINPNCHFYTVSLIFMSAIEQNLPDNIENVFFTSAVPSLHQDIAIVREFWNAVEAANLTDAKRFVNVIALEAFISMKFSLQILQESGFPKKAQVLNEYLQKHPIAELGLNNPLHWDAQQREFGPTTKLMALTSGKWLEIK